MQLYEDPEVKQQRQATQLKRAHSYQSLFIDERFQIFKQEQFDDRIESLKKLVLGANVLTEEGRQLQWENTIRYQELEEAVNRIFKLSEQAIRKYQKEQEVKKKLKESEDSYV